MEYSYFSKGARVIFVLNSYCLWGPRKTYMSISWKKLRCILSLYIIHFSPHAALHTHSWYKQKDLLQPGLGYQELITDAKERQRCFQCTDREMNTYTFSYNIFLYRFIDCIFLMSLIEDILFMETVTVVDERLQYVGLCSEANFIVPYML